MRIKILLKLIIFLFYTSSFAQNDFPQHKRQPDPLIKVIDISPTLSNGLANQEINLFNISLQNNIQIPINLNYFSRGNKVGEIASEVGLGWNLNIPYKITRNVLGIYDEDTYGLLNNNIYLDFFTNLNKRQQIASENGNYNFDFLPDHFYFSLPGKSGKFILDWHDQKVILQKFDNLKIDYKFTGGKINEFTISDEKGNVYYYGKGALEYTNIRNYKFKYVPSSLIYDDVNADYYDSWYLTHIKFADQTIVDFIYSDNIKNYFSKKYDTVKKFSEGNEEAGNYTFFDEIRNYSKKIDTIRWSNGSVNFKYSDNRQDLLAGHLLEEVELRNNREKISSYKFNHFYSEKYDSTTSTPFIFNFDHSAKKRLFLRSLEKTHPATTDVLNTKFYYNEELLPDRFSNSIDAWGYYNGANNGYFVDDFSTSPNRQVDSIKSMAGILEKIEFPGGSAINYKYENNIGLPSIMDPSVVKFGAAQSFTKKTFFFYVLPGGTNNYDASDEYGYVFTKEFIIPENLYRLEDMDVDFSYNNMEIDGHPHSCELYYGEIYDEDNNPVELFPNRVSKTLILKDDKKILKNNIPPPGLYKLKISAFTCNDESRNFRIDLSWSETLLSSGDINEQFYILGEGKRIKSIEHRDQSQKLHKVLYEYVGVDNKKSGKIIGFPSYQTILAVKENPRVYIFDPYGVRPGSPISSYNINSIIYSAVTEFEVDEFGQRKGKTVYDYSHYPNGGGKYYRWPYYYPIDNEWLRGLPTSIRVYENRSGAFEIIRETVNTYKIGKLSIPNIITDPGYFQNSDYIPLLYEKNSDRFLLPLARFYLDIEGEINPQAGQPPTAYLITHPLKSHRAENLFYKPFYYTGGRLEKDFTQTTEFLNGKSIITRTEFFYDNPSHYQLTSEKKTFPDLSMQETNYQYADEQGNAYLQGKNMVGVPIKIEIKKTTNGVVKTISKTLTNFPTTEAEAKVRIIDNSNNKDFPLPFDVSSANLQTLIIEKDVNYDFYDNKGNLLQYTMKPDANGNGGMPTAIIWGYNQTQPIAKIEGAKLSDIPQGLITAIVNASDYGSSSYSEAALLTQLDAFRTSFPNYQISTYTYKPLIGVTTITPPSGIREIYNYDTANRLQSVLDIDGNILKEYKYNYKP